MKPKESRSGETVKAASPLLDPPCVLSDEPPPHPETETLTPPRPARLPAPAPKPGVPAILLEGDEPPATPVTGPGQRYALGPKPPAVPLGAQDAQLPEAYGTGRLLLVARDPHCLYAQWDLTADQQRRYNALSADHHLIVRVHPDALANSAASELHMHPESRHWFVHVERSGQKYVVALGYYQPDRQWRTLAVSETVATPPDTAAEVRTVQFAAVRLGIHSPPFGQAEERPTPPRALDYRSSPEAPQAVRAPAPVGRASEARGLSAPVPAPPDRWTAAQEHDLAETLKPSWLRMEWLGSAEMVEFVRRQPLQEISSIVTAQFGLPAPLGPAPGISSLMGGPLPVEQGFWFSLNAELIIYGATEPDARVTIGGQPLQLRPDGTFNCRFALPDGTYELSIAAESAQGEVRHAQLRFCRATASQGEVGPAPPDPALKPPPAENVV